MRIFLGLILIFWGISALTGWSIFRFIIPLFIIWIGLKVLLGKSNPFEFSNNRTAKQNSLDEVNMFTEIVKKIESTQFNGGKLVSLFGMTKLDLSSVKAEKKELRMEVVAIFGGAQLKIPKNWKVKSEEVAILGGFSNQTNGEDITLILKGASIFGGIEIIN